MITKDVGSERSLKATADNSHPDDVAVYRFAKAMRMKMARKRGEGKYGWDDPNETRIEDLVMMTLDNFAKGDFVDVANLCMMLWHRGGQEALKDAAATYLTRSDDGTHEELVSLRKSRLMLWKIQGMITHMSTSIQEVCPACGMDPPMSGEAIMHAALNRGSVRRDTSTSKCIHRWVEPVDGTTPNPEGFCIYGCGLKWKDRAVGAGGPGPAIDVKRLRRLANDLREDVKAGKELRTCELLGYAEAIEESITGHGVPP